MLKKLMKYEIKATGRMLLPLYVALITFAIINKIFLLGTTPLSNITSGFLGGIPAAISIFAYGCIMAAVFIVTLFIIIQRFYKNLLGDEGYLMNTLPVTAWKNISSKLIIALLWSIVSGFIAILSIFIMVFNIKIFSEFFPRLGELLSNAYSQFGLTPYILGIEIIICGLLQLSMTILMIYSSISLGHLFNKRKILCSFGAFVILNLIMNTLTSIIGLTYTKAIPDISNPLTTIHSVLLGGIAINLIFFVVYFIITSYIIKNKLNLE